MSSSSSERFVVVDLDDVRDRPAVYFGGRVAATRWCQACNARPATFAPEAALPPQAALKTTCAVVDTRPPDEASAMVSDWLKDMRAEGAAQVNATPAAPTPAPMTREAFLAAVEAANADRSIRHQIDLVVVRQTRPLKWLGQNGMAAVKAAWKAIGGKGKVTLKALRALPVEGTAALTPAPARKTTADGRPLYAALVCPVEQLPWGVVFAPVPASMPEVARRIADDLNTWRDKPTSKFWTNVRDRWTGAGVIDNGAKAPEVASEIAPEAGAWHALRRELEGKIAAYWKEIQELKAKIPPKEPARLSAPGYVRFDSAGKLWLMSSREGWSRFGVNVDGWDDLFRRFAVRVTGHGADAHGMYWTVVNNDVERTPPAPGPTNFLTAEERAEFKATWGTSVGAARAIPIIKAVRARTGLGLKDTVDACKRESGVGA